MYEISKILESHDNKYVLSVKMLYPYTLFCLVFQDQFESLKGKKKEEKIREENWRKEKKK